MQQKEENTWATLAHLGGIIGTLVIPSVGNILGALIIWLIKRNESAFVDDQGKEALNFQITLSLANAALGIITAIRFGFWSFNSMFFHRGDWDFDDLTIYSGSHGVIWILNIVFSIIAAVRANKGIGYKYPVSWRLVK
ncbi:hypothetical protein SAMN05518672_11266 [Chitinophaga sp. CF118]|uniref:DUF4870 domain-containing protein n=1 Tax=Chitinophaga sp. CF118 TaxID=1884367 RepID=UPI0008E29ECC|nr:DUF4870 domain-containing protein [Chitinophaga sp. CF118]SFE92188.1 hypothetical protein SAMN05518672_11266 [Chitinophaga sp. CF118]